MSIRVFMPGKDVNWPFPPTERELRAAARANGDAAALSYNRLIASVYFGRFWQEIAVAFELAYDQRVIDVCRQVMQDTMAEPPLGDFKLNVEDYGAERTGPTVTKLPMSSSQRRWGGRDARRKP